MNNYISQNAGWQIKNAQHLPTCHSTNSYANDWLKANEVDEGWVVYTFDQTNGRGQSGNAWESESDKNLTFSVVYKPIYLLPKDQFFLNMAVSLAIVKFLERLQLKAEIKWPNDIYVSGKKIAGILIENHLRGDSFRYSVIGIGLNVNQSNFKVSKATSICLELDLEYHLVESLVSILEHLRGQMERLKLDEWNAIKEEYHHNLYLRNRPALFREEDRTFVGTIKGVDETGRLRIITESGEKKFGLKEVAFLN